MKRMKRSWTGVAFLCCVRAFAQDPAYQDYMAQIETLQHDSADIAQRYGRDALIEQYRAIINAYPGYVNNIRLETQIGMIYESDFTSQGLPPDAPAAYDVYQNIIANYDAEHPYMKTVRKLAADRAAELDPPVARQMYESIIADYPEEDALIVQSTYALGKLEEAQGNPAEANAYFDQVLAYAPTGASVSEAEAARIEAYQSNAAASMLTAAIKGYDTPQDRLKALKKFLEKHKEFERANAGLIRQFAEVIERTVGRTPDDEGGDMTVEALLASLKKNSAAGENTERRDRSRTREQRARDAEAERTRIARAEASVDAASANPGTSPVGPGTTSGLAGPKVTRASGTSRTLYTIAAVVALLVIATVAGLYARRRFA